MRHRWAGGDVAMGDNRATVHYATQPGQPLAGLSGVTQLDDDAAALNGKLVDADPSFITTQQNAKRLQGYGIELKQVASSEAAELAELRRAHQAHDGLTTGAPVPPGTGPG